MNYLYSVYHWLWSFFGALYYGFPSRKLYVVGVTGTKGKSTTVELMSAMFESAGEKTAVMSSVTRKVGETRDRNMTGNTMPGRFAIQKFLRDAVRAKCTYAFIEVTSQGVLQHRHRFIDWNAAVFLNLAPEHIESHGSFEKYRDAKVSFFSYVANSQKRNRTFFVNTDDASADYFIDAVTHTYANSVIRFSGNSFAREVLGAHLDMDSKQVRAELGEWVLADFNLEDEAAAYALAVRRNVSWDAIYHALTHFKGVPGRFEILQTEPFMAVIDYAHTPDSLRKVYETLKKTHRTNGEELICVLGSAGGGRDKWKRPEMGRVAAELCTRIVLTNEDPYDEDPLSIMKEIRAGIVEHGFDESHIYEQVDRREAIRKALSLAGKGDVVIATGKGSETSIHGKNGTTVPWSERDVMHESLNELTAE